MSGFKKIVADNGPTTELFVPTVLDLTSCTKHGVNFGVPCFTLNKESSRGQVSAVCNSRALRAGYNAPIDPRSVDRSLTRPKADKHAKRS